MKEHIIFKVIKGYTEPFLCGIPILFWWISTFFFHTPIYISQLDIRLSVGTFYAIVAGVTIFWVLVSPFKTACKTYSQHLARNLLPVEIILLLFVAQFHFTLAMIMACLTVAALIFWKIVVKQALHDKKPKTRRMVSRRLQVQTSALLLSVTMVIGLYSMFTARAALLTFSTEAERVEYVPDDEICANTSRMLEIFDETVWETTSLVDRADVLQHFLNLETAYLQITPLILKVVSLNEFVIGAFHPDREHVYIDITHLRNGSPEDLVNTVTHEAFHSFQQVVLEHVDFTDEFVQTSYFYSRARYWLYNSNNYISSEICRVSYWRQPLEQDARAHAASRTRYWTERINQHQHTAIQLDSNK